MPDGGAGSAAEGPLSHQIVRVARAHRRLAAELLRRVGLHPGQELMLMFLWEQDHRPQSELVGQLGVEAPTVTKVRQRLEQQGLVVRERPAANRRTAVVSLTPKGRGLRREVQELWAALEESTTADLDPADRSTLGRLLERVENNLADDKPGDGARG
jgi:DNA-binding MarR family transcriptional regulator